MNVRGLRRRAGVPFRRKRMGRFRREFGLTPGTRVLDVGGSLRNWLLLPERPWLAILNSSLPARGRDWRGALLIADGCRLPFKDGAFDVVYSNSVIEHVGDLEAQRAFAREHRRVGVRYYVQTPNKWFPIEPHWIVPFIHWLPRGIQRRLVRRFTLRGLVDRLTEQKCEALLDGIRLLDAREMRSLFPGARIWRERVLGLAKSLIAVKSQ
jgi:SAM-dependent methyltransferase